MGRYLTESCVNKRDNNVRIVWPSLVIVDAAVVGLQRLCTSSNRNTVGVLKRYVVGATAKAICDKRIGSSIIPSEFEDTNFFPIY